MGWLYVPKHERPVISALLTAALQNGNTISVDDGEGYVIEYSESINAVRAVLGGSGEDTIVIRDIDGNGLGHFYLIYDNGSEGDPLVVIADYADNDFCNGLYYPLCDRYND